MSVRISNSCHSCKAGLTDVPYVTCRHCRYKYCGRQRCLSRLQGSWSNVQQRFNSGQPCSHCIYVRDWEAQCINTNCNAKRKLHVQSGRRPTTNVGIAQSPAMSAVSVAVPHVAMATPVQPRMHTSMLPQYLVQPSHMYQPTPPHMMPPMLSPHSFHPLNPSYHPQRHMTNVVQPVIAQPHAISQPVPVHQSSVTAPALAFPATLSIRRAVSEPFSVNNDLDTILDQFAGLTSVQLAAATAQHPYFAHTAIPTLVQTYNIPGHSLLATVSPALVSATNLPADIQSRTIDAITKLINRQQQRMSQVMYSPIPVTAATAHPTIQLQSSMFATAMPLHPPTAAQLQAPTTSIGTAIPSFTTVRAPLVNPSSPHTTQSQSSTPVTSQTATPRDESTKPTLFAAKSVTVSNQSCA